MNNLLKMHVENNAKWVRSYDTTSERNIIEDFFKSKKLLSKSSISVADIGCGNGRSTDLLRTLLGDNAKIWAIDKCSENIAYAQRYLMDEKIQFETIDAFDFFLDSKKEKKFDIVFFSWSFFDMTNEDNYHQKRTRLNLLIELTKKCLKSGGIIIVLQPTKGGAFEKLLSKFMPGSDADYKLVHDFLKSVGFNGAISAFPNRGDKWTIWSEFRYTSKDDIFSGVESVLYLEQRKEIEREHFDIIFDLFKKDYKEIPLRLSDCVNFYYYIVN